MTPRRSRYITIPLTLWLCPDLTVIEKAVMVELDSACGGEPYDKPLSRIATNLGIPKSTVSGTIASLQAKGAVDTKLNDDGNTIITPFVFKQRFAASAASVVVISDAQDTAKIDYDAVLTKWTESNPDLPKPRSFTPKMQQQLRTLLRNNSATVDDLYRVFDAISCSDFLQGRTQRGDWKADINWLLRDSKSCFMRILSGEFHRSDSERAAFDQIFSDKTDNQNDNYYR